MDRDAQAYQERIDELEDALTGVVAVYKRDNPMRTADMHNPSCTCMRCAIDAADAVLARVFQGTT